MRRTIFQTLFTSVVFALCGTFALATDAKEANQGDKKQQLVEAAADAYDEMTAKYKAGTVTEESLYLWSRRWMEAELATLDANSPKRVGVFERHLERKREEEKRGIGLWRLARITDISLPALRFYVLEAELLLEKEQQRAKEQQRLSKP